MPLVYGIGPIGSPMELRKKMRSRDGKTRGLASLEDRLPEIAGLLFLV